MLKDYLPEVIENLLEETGDPILRRRRYKQSRRRKSKNSSLTQSNQNRVKITTPAQVLPYLFEIYPRNDAQQELMFDLTHNEVAFIHGIAGTGKTFLAVSHCIDLLCSGAVRKIILSRPAVESDEKLGFLPGKIRDKMDPYLWPLFDAAEEKMAKVPGGGKRIIENWIETGILEISPLGFMRGRTFRDAAVLLDEAQNATFSQLKMFLTRIGEGSYLYLNGDLSQSDIGVRSGYAEILSKVEGSYPVLGFSEKDCVRSEHCKVLTNLLK